MQPQPQQPSAAGQSTFSSFLRPSAAGSGPGLFGASGFGGVGAGSASAQHQQQQPQAQALQPCGQQQQQSGLFGAPGAQANATPQSQAQGLFGQQNTLSSFGATTGAGAGGGSSQQEWRFGATPAFATQTPGGAGGGLLGGQQARLGAPASSLFGRESATSASAPAFQGGGLFGAGGGGGAGAGLFGGGGGSSAGASQTPLPGGGGGLFGGGAQLASGTSASPANRESGGQQTQQQAQAPFSASPGGLFAAPVSPLQAQFGQVWMETSLMPRAPRGARSGMLLPAPVCSTLHVVSLCKSHVPFILTASPLASCSHYALDCGIPANSRRQHRQQSCRRRREQSLCARVSCCRKSIIAGAVPVVLIRTASKLHPTRPGRA